MITIPALVDSVKEYEGWNMTRLTYYSIACDSPASGSLEGIDGARIPFLVRGNAGVVYKPIGRAKYFRSREQIRELFLAIDAQPGLFLDIDDIWLPNEVLPSTKRNALVRGAVYRVSLDVLRHACAFRLNRITAETLRRALMEETARVRYSKDETTAFAAWSAGVIQESRDYLEARPHRRLAWDGMEDES